MANTKLASKKKKTRQGNGKFTKTPNAGGQAFNSGARTGSPPSKFRARRKPSRGQG